jgi:hypothetical protein
MVYIYVCRNYRTPGRRFVKGVLEKVQNSDPGKGLSSVETTELFCRKYS